MPERASLVTPRLILVQSRIALHPSGPQKVLRIERYLARQAGAAHNLGIPSLEHYYNIAYLALRLWRMEQSTN